MDANAADEQEVVEEGFQDRKGSGRASILFWAPLAVVVTLVVAATVILGVLVVG